MSAGGNGALGPGALAEVTALADIGVDRVIVPAFAFWRSAADELDRYSQYVIAAS